MNTIKKLDSGLINKIAAGEVVDRPVSVVKELTENAIDAGATQITIEIKEGGISYIRVTDNGSGISTDQVKTAFLRHATSKITNLDDLEQVMTLGFRGEALSSIAAVAQVEMITKTSRAFTGSKIEVHDGIVVDHQEAGCPEGTTVVIRNLFYHTPARYKFLKKPAAEGGYISDMAGKLALGHPEIAFTYINNSSILLQTSGNGDLKTAIFQVYGKEIAKKILSTAHEKDGYSISGYIGRPEIARGNRIYENFFLNGRFVKSDLVRSAVEEAYKTKLPVGKFPFFVLHLKTAPDTVDVNVHPTKLEVRFSQEELIFQMIRVAADHALHENNLIPEVREAPPKYVQVTGSKIYEAHENQSSLADYSASTHNTLPPRKLLQVSEALPCENNENTAQKSTSPRNAMRETLHHLMPEKEAPHPEASPSEKPPSMPAPDILRVHEEALTAPFFHQYKIIGQVFQTYWLVEQSESLYLIDQHAAHERIIYEELVTLYKKKEIASQQLLQPVAVPLSHRERQLAEEHKGLLESFGFDLENFGEDAYVLRAVPFIFNGPAQPDFILEIIDKLSSYNDASPDIDSIYEAKLSTIAVISCKAAVKANDKLSHAEAVACIEKLLQLEEPFTCPHGRPTIIEMTKQEMERRFKR